MKKRVLSLTFAACALSLAACTSMSSSTSSQWTHQQRKEMRRTISQYRDMVYIDEMSDAQFLIFSDDVTDEIASIYPNYISFSELPAVADSIDVYVTTTIVEQLNTDASNMKHIYPYRELRQSGVLPKGLSFKERRSFYKCFARKINANYSNFGTFFQAVLANTTDTSSIAKMQADCALSLFNYAQEPSSK